MNPRPLRADVVPTGPLLRIGFLYKRLSSRSRLAVIERQRMLSLATVERHQCRRSLSSRVHLGALLMGIPRALHQRPKTIVGEGSRRAPLARSVEIERCAIKKDHGWEKGLPTAVATEASCARTGSAEADRLVFRGCGNLLRAHGLCRFSQSSA